MTQRLPPLFLLLALVGGLASASVHRVHHGAEWAESRAAHLANPAHADGDHVSTPCGADDAAGIDCAICGGLGSAPLADRSFVATVSGDAHDAPADREGSGRKPASALARGPPAAA